MTTNDIEQPAPVRWGIIGLGEIAHAFARALPASRTGELVAVASSDSSRAAEFAAEHGARAVEGYDALLADSEVDAVYVATPHTLHAQWSIRAARAGKHVLCEKPFSPHPSTTMAMIEAAREAHTVLAEGYMYRYHPQTMRVLELIESGAVGEVRHVSATYSFDADRSVTRLYDPKRAGGAILDVGGYPLSMVMRIVAAATGDPSFREPALFAATADLSEEGVDMRTKAHVSFDGGVTAQLTAAISGEPKHGLRVTGSQGVIDVPQPWTPPADAETVFTVTRAGEAPEQVVVPAAAQYALEADAVAQRITADTDRALEDRNAQTIARVLHRWRTSVGVTYPFEARTSNIPTVDGGAFERRVAQMPDGSIPESDKRISRLVLGCDNQPDLTHGSVMWDDFFERGGNAFDTAYEYNDRLQQKLFGQWMTNRGVRDEAFVIGKGAHTPFCTPEDLEAQLLETLEDLQTDYLDMYFMHRDNEQIPVGEFIDVLDRCASAGTIRAFGGSNWSIERFEAANAYARANGMHEMTALSNHFGLAEAIELPWAGCRHVTDAASKRWLIERQVPVFAWASQARGFFARADRADTSDAQLVRCFYSDENFERLERCRALAAELGVAPTAVALAYVLHQEFPTFALFGPRSLEETRTSMEALSIELSPAQAAWLDLRG